MMDKKEKLQAIVAKGYVARKELNEIEEKENTKKNLPLVGRCFKFKNSYGSGDSWWLYSEVLGIEGNYFKYLTFQECSGGKITVELREYGYDSLQQTEITKQEFDKRFRLLLDKLEELYQGA